MSHQTVVAISVAQKLEFLERMSADDQFRTDFTSDPESALNDLGIFVAGNVTVAVTAPLPAKAVFAQRLIDFIALSDDQKVLSFDIETYETGSSYTYEPGACPT